MSDNRATRAHIAASRGYLHEYLSTDALLTDEIADALMRDVAGKSEQFDTGEEHGPHDTRTLRARDIVTDVETGESGTVLRDFGNGIVRVQWHDRKRRDGRRLVPLVTDIGAVRLCA